MRSAALAATLLFAAGCNCGERLTRAPDACDLDPGSCAIDSGTPEQPQTCTPGTIKGRVCAPDQHTWVNGATVSIHATDCNGAAVTVGATSAADGSFELAGVPAGHWTVHATLGS